MADVAIKTIGCCCLILIAFITSYVYLLSVDFDDRRPFRLRAPTLSIPTGGALASVLSHRGARVFV